MLKGVIEAPVVVRSGRTLHQVRTFCSEENFWATLYSRLDWPISLLISGSSQQTEPSSTISPCMHVWRGLLPTQQGSLETEALKATQEEADIRLLLHAQHASEDGYRAISHRCRGHRCNGPMYYLQKEDVLPCVSNVWYTNPYTVHRHHHHHHHHRDF